MGGVDVNELRIRIDAEIKQLQKDLAKAEAMLDQATHDRSIGLDVSDKDLAVIRAKIAALHASIAEKHRIDFDTAGATNKVGVLTRLVRAMSNGFKQGLTGAHGQANDTNLGMRALQGTVFSLTSGMKAGFTGAIGAVGMLGKLMVRFVATLSMILLLLPQIVSLMNVLVGASFAFLSAISPAVGILATLPASLLPSVQVQRRSSSGSTASAKHCLPPIHARRDWRSPPTASSRPATVSSVPATT